MKHYFRKACRQGGPLTIWSYIEEVKCHRTRNCGQSGCLADSRPDRQRGSCPTATARSHSCLSHQRRQNMGAGVGGKVHIYYFDAALSEEDVAFVLESLEIAVPC